MPIDFTRIRALREAQGLTLDEAGRRAGFPAATARQRWHGLETGRKPDPQFSTVEKICLTLGCELTEIVTRDSPGYVPKRGRPRGT